MRGEVDNLCHIVKHWLSTLCSKFDEILLAFKITVKKLLNYFLWTWSSELV